MIIPVLDLLIVVGAFSAEKLLLCSTSIPFNQNISETNELRLSQERQKKTRLSYRKKERDFTIRSRRSRNICLKLLCFAFDIKPFPDHLLGPCQLHFQKHSKEKMSLLKIPSRWAIKVTDLERRKIETLFVLDLSSLIVTPSFDSALVCVCMALFLLLTETQPIHKQICQKKV